MGFEAIGYEVSEGTARITLSRPDRLNAFTVQMHEELANALNSAERDEQVRALLLTGAGRGFCAGQDLPTAPSHRAVKRSIWASPSTAITRR